MKKNMGTTDKIIRVVLALIISGLYLGGVISGTIAIIALIVAAILLLTSFVSFCPLYWPFGLSSCKKPETKA